MNLDDEVVGQLIALIHGKQPSERNDRLKLDIREITEMGAEARREDTPGNLVE